jgi:hypothetical protein
LPAEFDPSLRILIAKSPGIEITGDSTVDGYLINDEDTFTLPQSAIS